MSNISDSVTKPKIFILLCTIFFAVFGGSLSCTKSAAPRSVSSVPRLEETMTAAAARVGHTIDTDKIAYVSIGGTIFATATILPPPDAAAFESGAAINFMHFQGGTVPDGFYTLVIKGTRPPCPSGTSECPPTGVWDVVGRLVDESGAAFDLRDVGLELQPARAGGEEFRRELMLRHASGPGSTLGYNEWCFFDTEDGEASLHYDAFSAN